MKKKNGNTLTLAEIERRKLLRRSKATKPASASTEGAMAVRVVFVEERLRKLVAEADAMVRVFLGERNEYFPLSQAILGIERHVRKAAQLASDVVRDLQTGAYDDA